MTAALRRSMSMLGWALDEEDNVGEYIERAEALLREITEDFELIVIDDGSRDRTAAIVEEYQRSRPWLRLHRNGRTRGSGYNTKLAIGLATKDYLFWQMVDWSYDLSKLPQHLGALQHCDVLQGVRLGTLSPIGMLRQRSDSAKKGLVSIVNYLFVRVLFGLPLGDYQNVTVYPRRLIQSIPLQSESAFTNPECLLKAWWRGATFVEFPCAFLPRRHGRGKGTRAPVVLRTLRDILYWWFRWVLCGQREHRGRGRILRWE